MNCVFLLGGFLILTMNLYQINGGAKLKIVAAEMLELCALLPTQSGLFLLSSSLTSGNKILPNFVSKVAQELTRCGRTVEEFG